MTPQNRETWSIRLAVMDDRPAISALIENSARGLSRDDYTEQQIESAIASVFGVDSDLIADGTYFVVEAGEVLAGCGGWSKRKTLFGGDQFPDREAGWLDPRTDVAKIRAFFVHPDFARQGIGRELLNHCEAAARAQGFSRIELMSTLPGLKLYRAGGYAETDPIDYPLTDEIKLGLVPMSKAL